MKKYFLSLIVCAMSFLLTANLLKAQTPQSFNYQAVARDGSALMAGQTVDVRFTLLKAGTSVYEEVHSVTTNNYGLFSAKIGEGTVVSGSFTGIKWGDGDVSLKVEIDRGTGFSDMGTTRLISVPYSLFADKADMALGDLTDVGTQAPTTGEVLKWNGTEWLPADDENTIITYKGGPGIQVVADTIFNSLPDQVVTLTGSGASTVTGTYPNFDVSSTDSFTTYKGGIGIQVIADSIINTDPDQVVSITGSGASTVTGTYPNFDISSTDSFTTYKGGVGIQVVGDTIINTDPDQVITLTGNGATAITGTYPNFDITSTDSVIPNIWQENGKDIYYKEGKVGVLIDSASAHRADFHIGDGKDVLWGADTTGGGDKLMWVPRLHAFRLGSLSGGVTSPYWDRDSMGLNSFALGTDTRARGYSAFALGRGTRADGSSSLAAGFISHAIGAYSTALGFGTKARGTTSTALGYVSEANGSYGVAMGFSAVADGGNSISIGYQSNATKEGSAAIGYQVKATGTYSTSIGRGLESSAFASTAVGSFNVGNGTPNNWMITDPIFEVGIGLSNATRANAMTILKNGRVGVGILNPLSLFHVFGEMRIGSVETIIDGGGFILEFDASLVPSMNNNRDLGTSSKRWSIVYATNGTINTSDRREKTQIQGISYGLKHVLQLNPVSFRWIAQPEEGEKLGLIAQEVQTVIPEVVKDTQWVTNEETGEKTEVEADRMGVYYSDLIPVLVKAIQEQQTMIDQQQKEIEALKQKVEALED